MLDSTARAERVDLSPSEPAIYTWEVAQKPVAVRLPLGLIDRLEVEAVETFRSLTSRGSEIGGLLLGSSSPGSPALVTVADFELVPCDYSRGPLYRLSDIDLGRFEQAIEKHHSGNGARVVGYFRSHTRKGLSLDAEDIAFFEPRFLDPQQLVLMIRPFATKASTAGIFIRENGRIGETSYLEFPFRSADLRAVRGGEKAESGAASPSASSTPSASAPKPSVRAQIVPIASRREISLPEPVIAAQPAAPIAAERVDTPVPPAAKISAPLPAVEPDRAPAAVKPAVPEAKAEPETKGAPEPKAVRPVPPEVKPAPAKVPFAEAKPETPKSNKMVRLVVAAAVCMLVLVGGYLVVYPMVRGRLSPPASTVQQDSSPLSLRVERTAGGMLLTWRRDLPVIQNATKVELSITDGDRHEIIQLDPNQVRSGSILYPPITQDVSFQLAVTDPHQAKTTSESLRVLDPRPSPLADPADPSTAAAKQTPAAAKPATPTTTTPTPEPVVAAETKPVEEAPVSHPAPTLKPFNTESLGQRLRPVTATDLPDAPAIVRSTSAAPVSLPGIVSNQQAPPPPPKAVSNTPTPAASTPAVVGGQLRGAEVISRVDPEYPKLARQAGASGLVELEATIGVDGKVKNPHVVKGNSMLQRAAIDAVLQWRYKPATLNGKPVESPVDIKLNFVPQR